MNPLLASLLHSIWQAGLLWLACHLLLRQIPARAASTRYRLALGAVCLLMVTWFTTWTLLQNGATQERVAAFLAQETPISFIEGHADDTQALISVHNPSPVASSRHYQDWLLIAWQAGVVIGFCRIASSVVSARKLVAVASPFPDPQYFRELERVCTEYGTRIAVGLRICEKIVSPMVVGIVHPTILLPATILTGVPPETLRAALAHEVAHVVRWDFLVNLLQMGTEALLFFNPFAWMLNQMVRQEREACCDAMASRLCGNAAQYSEALVWWSRKSAGGSPRVATAMSGEQGNGRWLRDRILRLLRPEHIPRTPSGWFGAGAAACLVALFFLACSQGVRLAVSELTAKERVETIRRLAAPFLPQSMTAHRQEEQKLRPFSGTIVDEQGEPISHASWTMRPPQNSTYLNGITGETGADGRFSGTLPNEMLRLQAEADGFAPTAERYELTTSAENVSVVLKQGIDFTIRSLDSEGKPLYDAEVTVSYGALNSRKKRQMTDENGIARFHHQPEGAFADFRIFATGYQTASADKVLVQSQAEPLQISLKKSEPFVVTVVDELDNSPISGVVLRATERWPETAAWILPKWNYSGLLTDAKGQAMLDGLNPDLTYGMLADLPAIPSINLFRRGALFRVNPGKDKAFTLRLPRERRLKLRIINLDIPENELTIQYGEKTSEHGADSSSIKLPVTHGVAETELRGLRTDPVGIYFLGLWSYSPALNSEITEFTIDYAKIKSPSKVRVILNLDVGKNGAAPTGSFWINWTLPGQTSVWDGLNAPITEGKAEFELPATARFRLNNANLLGGKIDEQKEYTVSSSPTVVTVPVKSAGLIRVKVFEKNGALAQGVFISARKEPNKLWGKDSSSNADVSIKNSSTDGDAREWYLSEPIELGSSVYRVVATCGNRFAVSQTLKINAKNPTQDIILTLPEAKQQEVLLVDESGQPAAGISFSTRCHIEGLERVAGSHSTTNADGRASLSIGSDALSQKYTIIPESGNYVRAEVPVTFSKGKLTQVVLLKGQRLAGRIIDKATEAGVAGVRITWSVWNDVVTSSGSVITHIRRSPEFTTDLTGRFEFTDAPAREVFLMVSSPLGKQIVDVSKSLHVTPGRKEVILYLEDAPTR